MPNGIHIAGRWCSRYSIPTADEYDNSSTENIYTEFQFMFKSGLKAADDLLCQNKPFAKISGRLSVECVTVEIARVTPEIR